MGKEKQGDDNDVEDETLTLFRSGKTRKNQKKTYTSTFKRSRSRVITSKHTMGMVVKMLEGVMEVAVLPPLKLL